MQLWSIWESHATPQVLLASSCFSSEFDFGAASFRIQDLGTVQQGVQQHTLSTADAAVTVVAVVSVVAVAVVVVVVVVIVVVEVFL